MNCWIILLLLLCGCGNSGNQCGHCCKPEQDCGCSHRHECEPKESCCENSRIMPPPRDDFGYHRNEDCGCQN